jgi:nucleoside-diphosphate-sugar epimerase
MSVLITGGSGFIALNLAEALLARGETVVLLSRHAPPAAAARYLSGRGGHLAHVPGDVRDGAAVETILHEQGVDRVFHGAAVTAGAERERREARVIVEVNLLGTLAVLEAARRAGVRRLVYLSSSSVYGHNAFQAPQLDEQDTLPVPDSLYAITKYAAERASLRYRALWGLDVRAARVGTAFGPWERDTGVRDTLSPPLQAARLALAGREAVLPRAGRRDWAYSRDVAAALVALMDADRPAHPVYNVGPGREWTVAAWCEKLAAAYPAFSFRLARDGETPNVDYYLPRDRAPFAIRRLVEDLGYQPRFGLEEAFQDYAAWLADFAGLLLPAERR